MSRLIRKKGMFILSFFDIDTLLDVTTKGIFYKRSKKWEIKEEKISKIRGKYNEK